MPHFLADEPMLDLSFSSDIPRSSLEEGDDFSFLCRVRANPDIGQLQWARDVSCYCSPLPFKYMLFALVRIALFGRWSAVGGSVLTLYLLNILFTLVGIALFGRWSAVGGSGLARYLIHILFTLVGIALFGRWSAVGGSVFALHLLIYCSRS